MVEQYKVPNGGTLNADENGVIRGTIAPGARIVILTPEDGIVPNSNYPTPITKVTMNESIDPVLAEIATMNESKQRKLDQICLVYVSQKQSSRFKNREEFLDYVDKNFKIYITLHEFVRALRDAGKRGLIEKVNKRWRVKLPLSTTK